jgi:hypothetical protein
MYTYSKHLLDRSRKTNLQVLFKIRYFDADYGVMNEKGVAIGESTCSAKIVSKACKY